jgi:hypothetical protein
MKGLPRSNSRGPVQKQELIKQCLMVRNVALNVDGAAGVGFGTVVVGDLPEGNILFLGGTAYITVSKVVAAGVIDTFTGNYSLGSAPTADATLSGAEIDLIPSTVLAAATGGVSPRTRAAQPAQAILDNTDGSLEINLNVLIDDASISANGQSMSVSGDICLLYAILLDD